MLNKQDDGCDDILPVGTYEKVVNWHYKMFSINNINANKEMHKTHICFGGLLFVNKM